MNPTIISGDTGISVWVLLGTFPLLVVGFGIYYQLRALRKEVRKQWTLAHQRIWSERLGSHNSKLALEIPDPDDVVRTVNGKL